MNIKEPGPEPGGDASKWTSFTGKCRKCDNTDMKYRVWESSCGGYEDNNYWCSSCGHSWWVDGPDS
jgi:hypothetical protein